MTISISKSPGAEEKLGSLLATAETLVLEQNPNRLLRFVVRQAAESVGAERCSLFLKEKGKDRMYTCYAMGEEEPIEVSLHSGIVGDVARHERGVTVADARSDPRFDASVDSRTGFATRSVLAVPIRGAEGELIGVLEVLNKLHGPFTLLDSETLEGLAALLGAVFDRAKERLEVQAAYRDLRHREQQIRLLYCFERALANQESMNTCMPPALELLRQSLSAEGASILLSRKKGDPLQFCWVTEAQSSALVGVTLNPGEGIAAEVFASGEARIVTSAQKDPNLSTRVQGLAGNATQNMMVVPLVSKERPEGVLEIVNSLREGFTSDDLVMSKILADIVAGAVQRIRKADEDRQAERLATVGKMASSIIHDLKNPLSILLGYANFLNEDGQSAPDLKSISGIMVRQTERCQRLIRDLLDFCGGKQKIQMEPLVVRDFLEILRTDLQEDLARSKVTLEITSEAEGGFEADQQKLERVFSNLASNARAVMPEGGCFRIDCKGDEDRLVFRVSDTGPGIPKQVADHLFEPFVTFGKREGTGLGLSIIKGIVDAHGGSIEVGSGAGAVFDIQLPRKPAAA